MKKTVSVLLVLTMLLALTSTAVASCKFKENDRIEFVRNTVAYKNHRDGSKTGTVVRKGSVSVVKSTCGDKWVELYLDSFDEANTGWFKVNNLKKTDRYVEVHAGNMVWKPYIFICYSSGGADKSSAYLGPWNDSGKWLSDGGYRISTDAYQHVKARASVWLHREPSLKKSYGKALHKGDKVKYLRQWALDSRLVPFLRVRYQGKCLWVSMQYTGIVK